MAQSEHMHTERKVICYTRQGRSEPRYYSKYDAGRIALYAQKSGSTIEEILAIVLIKCGYGKAVCAVLTAIRPIEVLLATLTRIGGTLALAALINAILQVLSNDAFKKLSRLRIGGIIFIVIAQSLEAIVKAVQELLSQYSIVADAVERLKTICIIIDGEVENGKY